MYSRNEEYGLSPHYVVLEERQDKPKRRATTSSFYPHSSTTTNTNNASSTSGFFLGYNSPFQNQTLRRHSYCPYSTSSAPLPAQQDTSRNSSPISAFLDGEIFSWQLPESDLSRQTEMKRGFENLTANQTFKKERLSEKDIADQQDVFIRSGRGCWTLDEDNKLRALADKCRKKKWTEISKSLPGRTPKQCRERWVFNLDPSIKRACWTFEEDLILLEKHEVLGNKWAKISMYIEGRTENAVKTRFKSLSRAMTREWNPSDDVRLIHLAREFSMNWDLITSAFLRESSLERTKQALMKRFDELREGLHLQSLPLEGCARRTIRQQNYPPATLQAVSQGYQNEIRQIIGNTAAKSNSFMPLDSLLDQKNPLSSGVHENLSPEDLDFLLSGV